MMKSLARFFVFAWVLVSALYVSAIPPAYAAEAVGGGSAVNSSGVFSNTGSSEIDRIYGPGEGNSADEILGQKQGTVTTEDVNNWVERKGNDLISIVTRVVQIVSILGFVFALIMIVVGAIAEKRTLIAGLIALIVSCCTFAAASCAPQIINSVSSWLKT